MIVKYGSEMRLKNKMLDFLEEKEDIQINLYYLMKLLSELWGYHTQKLT